MSDRPPTQGREEADRPERLIAHERPGGGYNVVLSDGRLADCWGWSEVQRLADRLNLKIAVGINHA